MYIVHVYAQQGRFIEIRSGGLRARMLVVTRAIPKLNAKIRVDGRNR